MLEKEKIETETANFHFENNMLYVQYKDNADVELKHVQANFKVRQEIQRGEKMLVLVDVSRIWQFSNEARKFIGRNRLEKLTIAMAVLIGYSMPVKIVANFFIKLDRPTYPTKLFKSKTKATAWLSSIY